MAIVLLSAMCCTCITNDLYAMRGFMLSIRLSEQTEKRLEKLSRKTGRTKTYYVREAVEQHLDDLEDMYLSLSRLEKPAKRWKLEDLEKGLDLDN